MNQQQRAVVQQALEALGNITNFEGLEKARAALRQLLEQPEPVQEPDIFPDEAYEMGLERIAYYTTPPAQPAAVQDWKDRLIAQHEETILWQAKRIAELTDQQPAQPAALSLEDSLKVTKVCCGDYANCHAPCTPRGRWQAHQEPAAFVGLTDEEIDKACDCLHVLWMGDDDQELVGTKEFARAIEAKLREKNGGAAQPADHSEQHLDMVDIDEIAAFCRIAFGKGAADFNAGVDAMLAELKLRQKNGVTTPPAQQASQRSENTACVGLTVDELIELEGKHRSHEALSAAIKAKLREKNGGAA